MKQAWYIMELIHSGDMRGIGMGGEYSVRKIDDQPVLGFKQREIAYGHLKNLLTEGKGIFSGSNSFILLEIFNKQ